MTYADADIDDAIERIAADVERRYETPEFHGPEIAGALESIRAMEEARRSAEPIAAARLATAALTEFARYRPTNATSRSKALLVEVLESVAADV